MKKSIISIFAIVGLTIFISGLGYSQQMNRQKNIRPMRQKMERTGKMDLMKKLNLTDQQKQKFADMRITFKKKMVDLKADLQKNKIDLKALRVNGNFNRSDIIAAVKKVNQSKDAISLAVANHMVDMYEVLTPEQQKIWKENAPKFWNMRQHRGMMWDHGMMHNNMLQHQGMRR
jgi:Spy/CpxP family protein refolding chaperone